jgi:methyl-accepting chemotaxis protein
MSSVQDAKGTGKGLLIKISGMASVFVLISIVVLAFTSIMSMESLGLSTAILMGNEKIKGDMASFEYMLIQEYGSLSLKDNAIVDQNGNSLYGKFEIVDRISKDLHIVATIFMRENNDFRRITTSIVDASGKRAVDTFLGSASPAFAPIQAGRNYSGEAVILGNNYITEYRPLFAQDNRQVIGILFIGIETSSIQHTIINNSKKQIVQIGIIALVIIFLAVVMNSLVCKFMLLNPINETVDMLKEISQGEGDLTKKLKVSSKDEIGAMAYYFNLTLEKIKNLVITIKQQTAQLHDLGNDLAANMTETATAMNDITTHVKNIEDQMINQSASVTETNTTMEQVTGNIDKLNSHVEHQTSSVAKSSSAIEEMLANIQSVTETLFKNTQNVNHLSSASEVGRSGLQDVVTDIQEIAKDSEGLLEINSVMENIASQTNLLSMNAAIEAAHAGEAGKGFAVVADEIRKLAESSGAQSKTISTVLKRIKESMDKITVSTDNVLNRFEAIDGDIKIVAAQEEHIRNAMEEQGQGSKQVLETIAQVNEITQQVKLGSEDMLTASKEVIRESRNLQKVTHDISEGVNEMAAGSDRINTAIKRVNELSTKNQTNIELLVEEVSRFKVE